MEILELTLKTNNLLETEKFYEQKIGFKKADKTRMAISFYVGTSKLVFELTENGGSPKYHLAFNIPTNQIEEAIKWSSQRLNLISIADNNFIKYFKNWNAKSIYFFDNNRNILEFISRSGLANSVNGSFSVNTILNISEIGVVTDEPLQLGNEIIEMTKAEFFLKGPKSQDFVAVGTDNGLFVISKPNRNWYPTQDKAEKHQLKTKIKVAENKFELQFN